MLSYLLAVSEKKCKFIQETIAKTQLHCCQEFGVCFQPTCRPLCTAQHCVLLVAPDSQYPHKALKKRVCASVPILREFFVPPAFPWRPSGGGPWHSAAGRERAGRARISGKILLPVHACRKTCWSLNCMQARTWLFSRTPPKS